MRRWRVLATGAAVALSALPRAASAHGASRGMHLHVEPDPAAAGVEVTVNVTAAEPLVRLRIGFTGHAPRAIQPDPPRRRLAVRLVVPEVEPGVLNLQAEGDTADGGSLRASAVLRIVVAD